MALPQLLALGALALYGGLRLRKHLGNNRNAPQKTADHIQTLEDVLEEDPVCHRLVPRRQALTVGHLGKTRYFCSDKCRRTFLQQGEQEA